MNKPRKLFLLFPYSGQKVEGYTIIYKNTFLNDKPPYIMVSFWGIGIKSSKIYKKNEDSISYYLIKIEDVRRFISLMNGSQKDYCDYYLESIYTNNAEKHNSISKEYAERGYVKPPKVKYIDTQLNIDG